MRFSDENKHQPELARPDLIARLTAYKFTEAKDGLDALLVGFARGDGPVEGSCNNVGAFKFCPSPRDGDDHHNMGFTFRILEGRLPAGLVLPEEPLAVSFPKEPTSLPTEQCVNLYWIDDLGPFAAKINVVVVDRQGHETGKFDIDVSGPEAQRRTSPSVFEDLWENYGKRTLLLIVLLFIVMGLVSRIRYYYRVAFGKRKRSE
ncbi:MAG: hypothetical protein SF187_29825 [Deltaproteobacteria bacterium]|nr:hypothetical protein [Deltaproteobacteria bacterium]